MSDTVTLTIDGKAITAHAGQTILEAAGRGGRLHPAPVRLQGPRPLRQLPRLHGAASTAGRRRPARSRSRRAWSSRTTRRQLNAIRAGHRRHALRRGQPLLHVLREERQLRAAGAGLPASASRRRASRYLFPERDVDASHPDIFIDRNRCILCARCVRASRDLDGKHVFEFVGRGAAQAARGQRRAALSATPTPTSPTRRVDVCPVGALLRKRVGYARAGRPAPVRPRADRLGHRSTAHRPSD